MREALLVELKVVCRFASVRYAIAMCLLTCTYMYTFCLFPLPLCLQTFGQTFIADDGFLAMVGTVSSLANMASRIFWGAVVDKYSYKVG